MTAVLCPSDPAAPPGLAQLAPDGSPPCGGQCAYASVYDVPQGDGTTVRRPGAWYVCERGHQWRPTDPVRSAAGRKGMRAEESAPTGTIEPYYQAEGVTIYNARWEDVVAAGLVPVREVALIHADPSYGIAYKTDGASRGRGLERGGTGPRNIGGKGRPKGRDFPKLEGDDKPHDPRPLLVLDRPTVSWGANHYASRLPDSSAWLSWDKRADTGSDDGSDVDLAWSNFGGPARRFVHLWRGTCRASETGRRHLWATQKPEALSAYVFEWARQRKVKVGAGALLLVPYMGSFPDYRPWLALGGRIIACDVSAEACKVAVSARILAAKTVERPNDLGPLFAGVA